MDCANARIFGAAAPKIGDSDDKLLRTCMHLRIKSIEIGERCSARPSK